SRGSGPASTSMSIAASATLRVIGPACDSISETLPGQTGTRPSVPLNAKTPQNAPGMRNEPPPSEPRASGTARVANVAADPELDPPGLSAGSQGLRETPVNGEEPVPFQPNSGIVV